LWANIKWKSRRVKNKLKFIFQRCLVLSTDCFLLNVHMQIVKKKKKKNMIPKNKFIIYISYYSIIVLNKATNKFQ